MFSAYGKIPKFVVYNKKLPEKLFLVWKLWVLSIALQHILCLIIRLTTAIDYTCKYQLETKSVTFNAFNEAV